MQASLNLSRESGAEMSEIKPQFGFPQIWEILKSGLKWDCRWALDFTLISHFAQYSPKFSSREELTQPSDIKANGNKIKLGCKCLDTPTKKPWNPLVFTKINQKINWWYDQGIS